MPTTFKSIHHPQDTPWGIVYTRFLGRPLAVCTIPLMIGATTSALLEQSVWGYLVWGLPIAIGLATVWTHFTMSRTIAEVGFRAGQAALRSVYDVVLDRPYDWKPIHSVRATSMRIEISVGRTTHLLHPNQWPNYDTLKEAARQSFRPEPSASASSSS